MPILNHSQSAAAGRLLFPRLASFPPALVGLVVQVLSVGAAAAIAAVVLSSDHEWIPSQFQWALLQGTIAAAIGRSLGMANWGLPIHLAFTPALVTALSFDSSPLWFLGAFLMLALVYGKTYQTQVPLFLSSRAAVESLAQLLPLGRSFSFIDLGSGCGGLLQYLRRKRPDGNYHGVEAAPLPFLIGRCRSAFSGSGYRTRWGDFWGHDLASYDVVYAYLSPRPMAELWRKARREMRPGSVLISNCFAIPGVTADVSLELHDAAGSKLYLWRM